MTPAARQTLNRDMGDDLSNGPNRLRRKTAHKISTDKGTK